MTQEEQQQVDAMCAEYQQIIVNLSQQAARNAAVVAMAGTKIKTLEARIAELEKPKDG